MEVIKEGMDGGIANPSYMLEELNDFAEKHVDEKKNEILNKIPEKNELLNDIPKTGELLSNLPKKNELPNNIPTFQISAPNDEVEFEGLKNEVSDATHALEKRKDEMASSVNDQMSSHADRVEKEFSSQANRAEKELTSQVSQASNEITEKSNGLKEEADKSFSKMQSSFEASTEIPSISKFESTYDNHTISQALQKHDTFDPKIIASPSSRRVQLPPLSPSQRGHLPPLNNLPPLSPNILAKNPPQPPKSPVFDIPLPADPIEHHHYSPSDDPTEIRETSFTDSKPTLKNINKKPLLQGTPTIVPEIRVNAPTETLDDHYTTFDRPSEDRINPDNVLYTDIYTTDHQQPYHSYEEPKTVVPYKPAIPEIVVENDEPTVSITVNEPQDEGCGITNCCRYIEFDDLYIRKHWDGRLKVLEFAATLGLAVVLPSTDHLYFARFMFYRAMGIVACVFVTNDLLLHLFSLWQHLPRFLRYKTLHMFLSFVASVCMLVGATLTITVADELFDAESMTLLAGFFGYVAMILFAMESLLHCLRSRNDLPYQSRPEY